MPKRVNALVAIALSGLELFLSAAPRVHAARPHGGHQIQAPVLKTILAADGSFTVQIPSHWQVTVADLDQGFAARSPSGECVFMLVTQSTGPCPAPADAIRVLWSSAGPVQNMRTLESHPLATPGLHAAAVHYAYTSKLGKAVAMEGAAQVITLPGLFTWSAVISGSEAPRSLYRQHMGLYATVLHTFHLNPDVIRARMAENEQTQQLIQEMFRSNQRIMNGWTDVFSHPPK